MSEAMHHTRRFVEEGHVQGPRASKPINVVGTRQHRGVENTQPIKGRTPSNESARHESRHGFHQPLGATPLRSGLTGLHAQLHAVEHAPAAKPSGDPEQSIVRIVGTVRLGTCEVIALTRSVGVGFRSSRFGCRFGMRIRLCFGSERPCAEEAPLPAQLRLLLGGRGHRHSERGLIVRGVAGPPLRAARAPQQRHNM